MAYGEVLARNVRGLRSRKGIGQKNLAARMRALGYTAWFTQTVGKAERGERRLLAEEIFALALALEVSIPALLAAAPEDQAVALPVGDLSVEAVQRLAAGVNDRSVEWDGDVPVLTPGSRLAPPLARIVAETLEGGQRGAGG